jgi:D-sedoheptulose 7-phosphate isomerase
MPELSLEKYYNEFKHLTTSDDLFTKLELAKQEFLNTKGAGGRLILAGNGGSAATVSHAAVDFTKQAKIPAICFNDVSLITAFSNDYGYDKWVEKAFQQLSLPNDIFICVSVSGNSPNLVNAALLAKKTNHKVITFTGKSRENTLYKLGDINFFVDSSAYNIVEAIHLIWLTSLVDMIIGVSVYDASDENAF